MCTIHNSICSGRVAVGRKIKQGYTASPFRLEHIRRRVLSEYLSERTWAGTNRYTALDRGLYRNSSQVLLANHRPVNMDDIDASVPRSAPDIDSMNACTIIVRASICQFGDSRFEGSCNVRTVHNIMLPRVGGSGP